MKRLNKLLVVMLALSLCASQGVAGRFDPISEPSVKGFGIFDLKKIAQSFKTAQASKKIHNAMRAGEKHMLDLAEAAAVQVKKRKLGKKGIVGAVVAGVSLATLAGVCWYKKARGYKINTGIEDAKITKSDFSGQVNDQSSENATAGSCFSFLKNPKLWLGTVGVAGLVAMTYGGYKLWSKKAIKVTEEKEPVIRNCNVSNRHSVRYNPQTGQVHGTVNGEPERVIAEENGCSEQEQAKEPGVLDSIKKLVGVKKLGFFG